MQIDANDKNTETNDETNDDTLTTDEKETYFEEEDDLFEEDDDEVNQSETADYRNDDVAPLGPWTKAQKSRVEPRDEMKAFVGFLLFCDATASLVAPPAASLDAILATAITAAKQASAIITDKVGAEVIKTKDGQKDLLTAVDPECQRVIEEVVCAAHPIGHGFLGEASVPAGAKASAEALDAAMSSSDSEYLWIVDPIDGTTNFVQSLPMVGVSIET